MVVARVTCRGLAVAGVLAITSAMDPKCADFLDNPDQGSCADCDGDESKYGPQLYGKCMHLRLVLSYPAPANSSHPANGTLLGACDSIPMSNTSQQTNCPVGWNCLLPGNGVSAKACHNGLFCHDNTCKACSGCDRVEAGSNSCGNCKTTFYPSVDEYSSVQIYDGCDIWTKEHECNLVYGCQYISGKCVSGPFWDGHELTNGNSTRTPEHVLFRENQPFFLEMGDENHGHSVVRSSLVIMTTSENEVPQMYAKIGVIGGFPRQVTWEQTGLVSVVGGNDCPVVVQVSRSVKSVVDGIGGACHSEGEEDVCRSTSEQYPGTECGFSTMDGAYDGDGKFTGMVWPPEAVGVVPQAALERQDCSQNMCGTSIDRSKALSPLQIYLVWAGTDAENRNMVSQGKSFASFHKYSTAAGEAMSDLLESGRNLKTKGTACLTNHQCGDHQ